MRRTFDWQVLFLAKGLSQLCRKTACSKEGLLVSCLLNVEPAYASTFLQFASPKVREEYRRGN
jgi:hypothetical protein